MEPTSS